MIRLRANHKLLSLFFSSLKGRIILGVSILVIVGLAVSDVIGIVRMQSFLSARIDQQINSVLASTKRLASRTQRIEFGSSGQIGILGRQNASSIQAPSPVLLVVYGSNGSVAFVRYNQLGSIKEPTIPSLAKATSLASGKDYFFLRTNGGDGGFRAGLAALPNSEGHVLGAVSLDEYNSTISHLKFLDLVVGLIVLLALVSMTYVVVRFGMRPLDEMEQAADEIAQGNLSLRINSDHAASEISRLGAAFNGMLGKIQQAFTQVQESERLSQSSQEQLRRFVADAGHELRTPLTSIMGYSELLQKEIDGDRELAERSAKRILQESRRMSGLVEELLLLANLDQRRPVKFERVDVIALVADCVQDARVIQPERDVRLEPIGMTENGNWLQPVYTLGDEENLRQAISNLVNNALLHTPRDTAIVVRVGTVSAPGSGSELDRVVIEVEDYGPGIKADALEHLFERFYRVDDNRGFKHGGFGLGLSVVESVVKAHDGGVTVRSVEGKGSCFRVDLRSYHSKPLTVTDPTSSL
ncbi:MAG: sensor histidine kinase [Actinomycetota bacterium]|nr:MAG: sensor histidine kinase [Actinomycetota bacterium]